MLDDGGSAPPPPRVGGSLGPYRIDAVIGTGGMGRVFRARREPDGEPVALKVIKPELALDRQALRRFLHEARAAAEVDNPHLVGVVDAGEAEGVPYLVMPLVEGETVEARIRREGRLTMEVTNAMAAQVGDGLDALHERDLVHRDVKASNIIFRTRGSAALTDFGLAKGSGYSSLTTPGQMLGTLSYLAPEVIRGQPAGAGTDLYALGCVVYECISGKPPFARASLFETGMAVLNEQPADPCAGRSDEPPGYGEAVLQALAKDPAARPPTASAYARLLQAAAHAGAR